LERGEGGNWREGSNGKRGRVGGKDEGKIVILDALGNGREGEFSANQDAA